MKIAVVGAGIVGVSCAQWLLRDGHEIVLIDRVEPGSNQQASFGGGTISVSSIITLHSFWKLAKLARMLLPGVNDASVRWRYLPRLVPWLVPHLLSGRQRPLEKTVSALLHLLEDSFAQHQMLAGGSCAESYLRKGSLLHIFSTDREFAKYTPFYTACRGHGAVWQSYDRARLLRDNQHLGKAIQYGVHFPEHGKISNPALYVAALARDFVARGGKLLHASAETIEPIKNGGLSVGLVEASGLQSEVSFAEFDRAVICCGAWSGHFARQYGHNIRLLNARGYRIMLENPQFADFPTYYLPDLNILIMPTDRGLICSGMTEFAGLYTKPNKKIWARQELILRRLFPKLSWKRREEWMGCRAMTCDNLPFIGEAPHAPKVYFAFGHQDFGLAAGPKTGRLVADMIAGRDCCISPAPFRVGRFD